MKRSRILTSLASVAGALAVVAAVAVSAFPFAGPAFGEETIHQVRGDVQPPVRTGGASPTYPPEAKEQGIEGRVMLKSVIDRNGLVSDIEVMEPLHPALDQAASEAVAAWTFEPALLDGQPVSVYYVLTINFRLDKDRSDS